MGSKTTRELLNSVLAGVVPGPSDLDQLSADFQDEDQSLEYKTGDSGKVKGRLRPHEGKDPEERG
jgi:hypothetical protein